MRIKAILLFVSSFAATTSSAADWRPAAIGGSGTAAYFDADSVSAEKKVVSVWIRYDFTKDNNERARSAKSLIELDCKDKSQRTLSIIRYAASGAVIQDVPTPGSPFEFTVPDSLGDEIQHTVCGYAALRAAILHR